LLVGCFEPKGKPLDLEQLPEDFAFGLLPEDWEHLEPILANALHRVPELEQIGMKMLLNGPESFTPDDRFLLGESPELRGFFLGCGMCSVGIATGGGAGRVLAEWVLSGEPSMDLWPVDVRRFALAQNTLRTLRERAPETLVLHYAVGFPGRQHQTARNLRLSPLHSRLEATGAEFGVRMGWERPRWFNPVKRPTAPKLSFGKPGWDTLQPKSIGRLGKPWCSSTSPPSASCLCKDATRNRRFSGCARTMFPRRNTGLFTPECSISVVATKVT
jgi:4-methylaminobutanoate oxidase (formaldehyde-forming)